MVSAAPQSAQNFLPGGFSAPHAVQRMGRGRGVPQSPQNFFPSILAAPQLGHSMPHPIDWVQAAYHSWLGPPLACRCARACPGAGLPIPGCRDHSPFDRELPRPITSLWSQSPRHMHPRPVQPVPPPTAASTVQNRQCSEIALADRPAGAAVRPIAELARRRQTARVGYWSQKGAGPGRAGEGWKRACSSARQPAGRRWACREQPGPGARVRDALLTGWRESLARAA
jgi:hypothetical protein